MTKTTKEDELRERLRYIVEHAHCVKLELDRLYQSDFDQLRKELCNRIMKEDVHSIIGIIDVIETVFDTFCKESSERSDRKFSQSKEVKHDKNNY